MTSRPVSIEMPASYPLWTLQHTNAPAWMIDLLADIYAGEITGTHGFGICHPRARWLRLVVSDREECPCGAIGFWEDDSLLERVVYCRRCADAEIALFAAADWRRAQQAAREAVPHPVDADETTPIPHEYDDVLLRRAREERLS